MSYFKKIITDIASNYSNLAVKVITQPIGKTVCDPQPYTQADMKFYKKLNTIFKAIRNGTWHMPKLPKCERQLEEARNEETMQQKWRELLGEYNHLNSMIEAMNKRRNLMVSHQLQQQKYQCEAPLKEWITVNNKRNLLC